MQFYPTTTDFSPYGYNLDLQRIFLETKLTVPVRFI